MSIIFDIRTIQCSAFKTLFESLKDILTDTIIKITESGIKIFTMNNEKMVLVHLVLFAEKFESYDCKREISIGINLLNFYKIIKTINNQDSLTLFMYETDKNHLGVKIDNVEKNTRNIFKINLLELDKEEMGIPEIKFNSVITLPSTDFHKIVRDMHGIADIVEIKCVNSELILTCQGEFCSQETIISDNDNIEIKSTEKDEIIQGNFRLKYLNTFTKCTGLSNNCELYMKNDYPLIVLYKVSSLGEIKLCLSPQVDTE